MKHARLLAITVALLALAATIYSTSGYAQSHVDAFGDFLVRSSAIAAQRLPQATTDQHGIERDAGTGVVNVSVYRRAEPAAAPIPAHVSTIATNSVGQRDTLEMRAIEANGRVHYLGMFEFAPRERIDFEVRVRPAGTTQTHVQRFQEQLFPVSAQEPD